MLSAADLAYTRQTQGLTLVERAILQHRSEESDGMGGSLTVVSYTGDIPCRVAPLRVQGAAEALVGGQLQGQVPWEITLPAETALDVSDRLNVGGTLIGTPPNQMIADGTGRWFEVLAIYAAHTLESARQCLCAERDYG
jgi:hypothetical protein